MEINASINVNLSLSLVLCDLDNFPQCDLYVVPERGRVRDFAARVARGEEHDVVAGDGVEAAVAVAGHGRAAPDDGAVSGEARRQRKVAVTSALEENCSTQLAKHFTSFQNSRCT